MGADAECILRSELTVGVDQSTPVDLDLAVKERLGHNNLGVVGFFAANSIVLKVSCLTSASRAMAATATSGSGSGWLSGTPEVALKVLYSYREPTDAARDDTALIKAAKN